MYTILEMAKELNCSKQTIRRYIDKLNIEAIENSANTQTKYYSDESYLRIREVLKTPIERIRKAVDEVEHGIESTASHTETPTVTTATVPQQQYDAVVAAKDETINALRQQVESMQQQLNDQTNTIRWYQVRLAAIEDKEAAEDLEADTAAQPEQTTQRPERPGFFRRIFRRS